MTDEPTTSHRSAQIGRRAFLGFGAVAALTASVSVPFGAQAASLASPPRRLSLLNTHTGERLAAEYWVKGRYVKDALRQFNHLLRDHRTDTVHPIDPELLDLVHTLQARLGTRTPIHIVSAYRSPQTNEWLREIGNGVARNSYHTKGMAVDLRLPGRETRLLHKAALRQRAGGVGYYPDSDFVHVDVGPVRTW
jgi:uncharacterized protein YcbK (DUF882 family)